jgi:apolipoprotein N-acyltransferase
VSATAFSLYARVEWPWFALGWIGLVPWLAALDRATSWRATLAAGLAMTELFTLAVFWWFVPAIAGYADVAWSIALVVVVIAAPVMQPQFLVAAGARHLARRAGAGPWQSALLTACAYVGAEWALPKLFADTIGHGFLASRLLRQAADLVGAHGLTFVLLIGNDCVLVLLRAMERAPRRIRQPRGARPSTCSARTAAMEARASTAAAVLASLVAGLAAYGAVRLQQLTAQAGPMVTVAAVQADISHYDRLARELGTYDAVRLILDRYFALTDGVLAESRPDVAVWPETVYPTTFGAPKSSDGAAFDAEIEQFVRASGVPLIFGTYDVEAGREYNAAAVLAPSGATADVAMYRKAQLFPFTERVPAWLDRESVRRHLPWLGTWEAGLGARVLDVPLRDGERLRIAPLICYDAVNPALAIAAVRDGAELLVTLSNDSWFAHGGGPRLHLVVSAFRSIETRRAQVRATNTGISALIDAGGERIQSLDVHARGALAGRLPRGGPATLMLAWGDWFGRAALAALPPLGVAIARRRRVAADFP